MERESDMSLRSFFEQIQETEKSEIEKIAALKRILEQLEASEQMQISVFSVTNNW